MSKKSPNGLRCAICDVPLFGKQKRFCSVTHHDLWWAHIREVGQELPTVPADPETQAFIEEFWKFLRSHQSVVKRIIKVASSD